MEKSLPQVAILVPAYKDTFLKKSLLSIVNQDYTNFKVVVVDDASPYNLKKVVDEIDSDKIEYHRNEENIGGANLTAHWNNLLTYATDSDLIVLASDDDVYDSRFVQTLVELSLKFPQVDLFHCRVGVIDENDEIIFTGPSIAEYESDIDFIYRRSVDRRTQLISDFMFRTEAIKRIGGFTEYPKAWYSDEMTVYKLAKDKGVVCAQDILFLWRSSKENISSQISDIKEKSLASFMHIKYFGDFIESLNPTSNYDKFLYSQLKKNYVTEIQRQLIYDLIKTPVLKVIKVLRNYPQLCKPKWMVMLTEGKLRRIFKI